mmetsp:Transcript_22526/g.50832  ORF Transcript_22526/g.50832 Transcript_22526/m.50832 type:complete len:209 (-) Transcript_22526:82-708(-)
MHRSRLPAKETSGRAAVWVAIRKFWLLGLPPKATRISCTTEPLRPIRPEASSFETCSLALYRGGAPRPPTVAACGLVYETISPKAVCTLSKLPSSTTKNSAAEGEPSTLQVTSAPETCLMPRRTSPWPPITAGMWAVLTTTVVVTSRSANPASFSRPGVPAEPAAPPDAFAAAVAASTEAAAWVGREYQIYEHTDYSDILSLQFLYFG